MLDPETLVAIDVHVHVAQDSHGRFALDQELLDASASYFKSSEHRTPTLAHIAAHYRARRIGAVVVTVGGSAAPPAGDRPWGPRLQVPPQPPGLRTQRPPLLPALRGAARTGRTRAFPHRADRDRRGLARRPRDQAALLGAHADR